MYGVVMFDKFVYQFFNHYQIDTSTKIPFKFYDNFREKVEEITTIEIELEKRIFQNHTWINFARNYGNRNPITAQDLIQNFTHNTIISKEFNIFSRKITCYALSGWRMEFLNDFIYYPLLILSIFVLVLLILFRNYQPLKSRGVGPYILISTYIILLTMYFIVMELPWEWKNVYGCYVLLIDSFFIQLTCIVPYFVYLRYLLIINFNDYKGKIYEKSLETDSSSSKWKFYIISKLVSPFTMFFIIITYLVISLIFYLVVIGSFRFKCNDYGDDVYEVIMYTHVCYIFVTGLGFYVLQNYDAFSNWKNLCKCKCKHFFITSDPFYFRLENLFIPLIALFYGFDAAVGFSMRNYTTSLGNTANVVVKVLLLQILIFIQILFPLIITIYKFMIDKFGKKVQLTKFDEILNEPVLIDALTNFAKLEWSQEIIFIKRGIIEYKISKNRAKIAEEICKLYFGIDSMLSLSGINDVKKMIENKEFPIGLFDSLEQEIDIQISSIITRFEKDSEYQNYQNFVLFKDYYLEKQPLL